MPCLIWLTDCLLSSTTHSYFIPDIMDIMDIFLQALTSHKPVTLKTKLAGNFHL